MNDLVKRLNKLENEIVNIKLILTNLIQQSSENEKKNLDGYKELTKTIEKLVSKLD